MKLYEDSDLDKAAIRWMFTHRGVNYEVCHHSRYMNGGRGIWNFYILINENSLSEEEFSLLWLEDQKTEYGITHDYYSILGCLDMPGGPTFYEKSINRRGDRFIEIGCDYNHLWDMERGFPYDLKWVKMDAEHSINNLLEYYPTFKCMCRWDGKYYPASEIGDNGYWIHRPVETKK